jgi:hypothetical protein
MFQCFLFYFDFFKVLVQKMKFLYFFTMINRQEDFFIFALDLGGKTDLETHFTEVSQHV